MVMMSLRSVAVAGLSAALLTATLPSRQAEACGCFAPPDPSVPIVQAGERILFSHADGEVTAHIQIQYEGEASEFGWLLPLPSVPEFGLGVEELFTRLINTTQPRYRLVFQADDTCGGIFRSPGAPTNALGGESSDDSSDPNSIVEIQGSIGPFDFVVLDAANRQPMFDWLVTNGYVIPTGTEDVVGPYIYEGAKFLALKLRKGNDAGDIQPVVIKYKSDLPMIPIVLTSVAANPNMGVQVWVLGDSRAIPRNYRHTVINEEYIDWFNAGSNYNSVVISATNEAPDGQSFVTEYAGTSAIMQDLLNWDGRFGVRSAFESETDASRYATLLRTSGFNWDVSLTGILRRTFTMPDSLIDQGITEDDFYASLEYYLGPFREDNPELFEGIDFTFDPIALTADIWERIVEPTLAAGGLFDQFPKLTRLYTTLSPEEMTRDPVFSFNPSLPDVSNVHEATFTFDCEDASRGILGLPDGRRFFVTNQNEWVSRDRGDVPFSRRIELLAEEGAPEIEIDNATRLTPSDVDAGGCGCSTSSNPSGTSAWLGMLLVAGLVWRQRRA